MPPLIDSVRSTVPSEWENYHSDDTHLVKLSPYDSDFKEIKSKMAGRTPSRVVRIENPFVWGLYQLRKAECVKRWKDTKEEDMWHVTNPSCVQSIAENNFDWRLSNRARYGQGVCFSPNLDHALRYSSQGGAIILAKVLVGRTCDGSYGTVIPPAPSDTTTGWCDYVYVKFMDHEFYPAYVAYL